MNLLDVILVCAGIFHKDLWNDPEACNDFVKGKYVCGKHYAELGTEWEKTLSAFNRQRIVGHKPVAVCGFPGGIEGSSQHNVQTDAKRGAYANQFMVKALFMMKAGATIQLGTPLCKSHFEWLQGVAAEYLIVSHHITGIVRHACYDWEN